MCVCVYAALHTSYSHPRAATTMMCLSPGKTQCDPSVMFVIMSAPSFRFVRPAELFESFAVLFASTGIRRNLDLRATICATNFVEKGT